MYSINVISFNYVIGAEDVTMIDVFGYENAIFFAKECALGINTTSVCVANINTGEVVYENERGLEKFWYYD